MLQGFANSSLAYHPDLATEVKSAFFQTLSVSYCGYFVNSEGIRPDPGQNATV